AGRGAGRRGGDRRPAGGPGADPGGGHRVRRAVRRERRHRPSGRAPEHGRTSHGRAGAEMTSRPGGDLLPVTGYDLPGAREVVGTLMAVTILAGRARGRPVTLRQALRRARQVFWRYGAATVVVGIVGQLASTAVTAISAATQRQPSSGVDLLSVFASTLITAPF